MQPRSYSILGIPVDDLDLSETIDKILEMINKYRAVHPRGDIFATAALPTQYVSTLNSNVLANANGFNWRKARNQEMLNTFRNTDLLTSDSMPVVWLSGWLGNRLKERVSSLDLIPPLAKALAQQQKTVFLLGGAE